MILDDFWLKEYDRETYNCSHFVRDLWLFLKDVDIGPLVGAFNSGELREAMAARRDLIPMDLPIDPSIAWFSTEKPGDPPHVGIFIGGRIFHMTPDGPRMQTVQFVSSQYRKVKYYDAKSNHPVEP